MKVISEYSGLSKLPKLREIYSGKKILLVTGKKSYSLSGAQEIIEKNLCKEKVIHFFEFSVNPKLEEAVIGANYARQNGVTAIIAVGGGSVLDMAKLIKAFYCSHGNEVELAKGILPVTDPRIPLIAIPTTAGSGSEATHFAVVYIGNDKYSLASDCLLADATILDGSLTTSGGKYLKTCNALDAISQAIESYWAAGSTKKSKQFAKTALILGWNTVQRFVLDDSSNVDRQTMMQVANLAGKAINISKTTAAHAWSYAFTSAIDVPHGHAVWLTLPAVFQAHLIANEGDVTDSRGINNHRKVIGELAGFLELQNKVNVETSLNAFLETVGVEHKMENLGAGNIEIRSEISKKVNLERMKNNPVDLSSYTAQIFRI